MPTKLLMNTTRSTGSPALSTRMATIHGTLTAVITRRHLLLLHRPARPSSRIYDVQYDYDLGGRLTNVTEPTLPYGYQNIAGLEYDNNGNRSLLKYLRNGSHSGPYTSVLYAYNRDNMLTHYNISGISAFNFSDNVIDGLGRLKSANEAITKADGAAAAHSYACNYDMRSQLTYANITGINSGNWTASYNYKKNGDMNYRTIQSSQTDFTYTGNQMAGASGGESFSLGYDLNGNLTSNESQATNYEYNWDGKLRYAQKGSNTMSLRYDPWGNRIKKDSSISGSRKYIVDVIGDLPVILLEINSADSSIAKTYIYANSQILAQHDGSHTANRYFYLHDRLGSVRMIIDTSANVVNYYTYNPFGEIFATDSGETITNPFKFTGQWYDSEIDLYYLRARNYHPHIYRFTSRDIIAGQFDNPLSLHKYLYCQNEPVNRIDPLGLYYTIPGVGLYYDELRTQWIIDAATEVVGSHPIWGPWVAFGAEESWWAGALGISSGEKSHGMFDYKFSYLTFTLSNYGNNIEGGDFSNYLAAYTTYYNYGYKGLFGAILAGDIFSLAEHGTFDDWDSVLWITRGSLDANFKLKATGRGIQGQLDEIILQNTKKQYGIAGFIEDLNNDELNVDWFY